MAESSPRRSTGESRARPAKPSRGGGGSIVWLFGKLPTLTVPLTGCVAGRLDTDTLPLTGTGFCSRIRYEHARNLGGDGAVPQPVTNNTIVTRLVVASNVNAYFPTPHASSSSEPTAL